jgi:DNA-binding response OmpR family regulator
VARPKKELGEILLEADLISETQLREALALQRTFGERLASVLVRQNILTEKFAVTYLGRQVGIPGVDLSKSEIDLGLIDAIPLELCERHLVFPIRVEGARLLLAMSDPTDHSLVSEIEFKTGVRLAPMIALEASIKNAILEARRALKAGRRTIVPTVQRSRTVALGGIESAAAPAAPPKPLPVATEPPQDPSSEPIPLARLTREEQTVLETLGGAPLPAPRGGTLAERPKRIPEPPAPEKTPLPPSPATAAPEPEETHESAEPREEPAPRAEQPSPAVPEATPVETAPPETAAETPAAATVSQASEAGRTILAVDDDENVVRFMEQLLVAKDYKVVTSFTGRDALAKVRESLPDLVILDGMLPEIHGFEICRQLKTSERFRDIPVILVSGVHRGWRFAADIKEKYGADDYIEKPFEAADFLRRVETLLHRTPFGPATLSGEAEARQHLKEGVVALKQERLDGAIASFTKGLDVDPLNDLLHYYLAMTFEKKDMVFHAIDHYEKAIQINPDFYDAITALANLYQKQEFWRKAVEMWELALAATKDETVRSRIKDHLLGLL